MISFTGALWPTLGNIGIALAVVALMVAVAVVITVVKVFAVDFAEFHGYTTVRLDLPSSFPCAESGGGGAITCTGESLNDFTIGGASLGLRMLAGAATVSTQLFTVIPGAMLAAICFQTLRGRYFSVTITRVLVGGAIAVLVLGIASDLLGGVAATAGLREVLSPDSEWYPETFSLTVTLVPFVGALALAALAAVFRQGMRLQREHEELQKDTEGLV